MVLRPVDAARLDDRARQARRRSGAWRSCAPRPWSARSRTCSRPPGGRRTRRRPRRGCCRTRRSSRRRRPSASSRRAPRRARSRSRARSPRTSARARTSGSRPRRSRRRGSRRRTPSRPAAIAACVAEVAGDQLAAELLELRGLRRIADERADLVAALAQLAGDMAADESGPPGEEYPHPDAQTSRDRGRDGASPPRRRPGITRATSSASPAGSVRRLACASAARLATLRLRDRQRDARRLRRGDRRPARAVRPRRRRRRGGDGGGRRRAPRSRDDGPRLPERRHDRVLPPLVREAEAATGSSRWATGRTSGTPTSSKPGFRQAIANDIGPSILAKGVDGLFLDNVDMIESHSGQRARDEAARRLALRARPRRRAAPVRAERPPGVREAGALPAARRMESRGRHLDVRLRPAPVCAQPAGADQREPRARSATSSPAA